MGRLARPLQGDCCIQETKSSLCHGWAVTCSETAHTASHLCLHASQRCGRFWCSATCAFLQGVTSPLAGQMLFRSIMFGSFAQIKTWLATNKDGSTRELRYSDYYKVNIRSLAVLLTLASLDYPQCSCSKCSDLVSCGEQAGAATGFIAAFVEGPIDFYKSQIQVQIIRSRADANYKRKAAHCKASTLAVPAPSCHTAPFIRMLVHAYCFFSLAVFPSPLHAMLWRQHAPYNLLLQQHQVDIMMQ